MTAISELRSGGSGRVGYREISLYAPDRTPCALDVSDNTNLWGMPPSAERTLRETSSAVVTRYPSLYAAELKRALSDYLGVEDHRVVTGCGSDDVLDSAMRALAEPGDSVAYPDPSFAMIPIFARMNGLQPVPVPLDAHCDIDPDRFLATGARIIYLCSPNNPTGNSLSRAALEHLVDRAPGVVIIDEAYAEFAEASHIDLARRTDRVLITRTMSKAFGLAGLRIGYATGAAALIAEVEKSRGPYKVSALAERVALSALRDDRPWVTARIGEVIANRRRLEAELVARGLCVLPSHANFLLCVMPDAVAVAARLRALGVAVRPFADLPPDRVPFVLSRGSAMRITIGPWPVMQDVLGTLDRVMAERRA